MIERVLRWSIAHRWLVLVGAGVWAAAGLWALSRLPWDAFPDMTPVQVQVNAVAPGLAPLEVEQQMAFPLEQALGGLPGLHEMRSLSRYGLAQVTLVFADDIDFDRARQRVSERLMTVEWPAGFERPTLGPNSTGLGEVFQYVVSGAGRSLEELTTLNDWVIKPRLRATPGVAEITTWGGQRRQYQIRVDPRRLIALDLTLPELVEAVRGHHTSVGGGYLDAAGEMLLVHGAGRAERASDLEAMVIRAREGTPVLVRDVAQVAVGHEQRFGAATADGAGEVVLGLGFMLPGENSRAVTRRLRERLDAARAALPDDVDVRVVYDRTELVDHVLATIRRNLFEAALLVVAVLFVFLGNLRAGLIVALAIPLSMLFAFNAMLRFGIAGTLLSLGAIDFGLLVDSAVVQVEHAMVRLGGADRARNRLDAIAQAVIEVRRPTIFGELIIMIVYVPVLLLEGIEGKLFRPMALTVIAALTGSLIASLTVIPALAAIGLPAQAPRGDRWLMRVLRAGYRPLLAAAMRHPRVVVAGLAAAAAAALGVGSRLGVEFVPRLAEESIVINTVRLAGISLEESIRYGLHIERALRRAFPNEIRAVWTRTGTAEVATDPMGIEVSDVYVALTPRSQWKRASTQADLARAMAETLQGFPGMRTIFTQPIELRVNELTSGVRADIGIKIFGDDVDTLRALAERAAAVAQALPQLTDVALEPLARQPMLQIRPDPEALARHGVAAAQVLDWVQAVGGLVIGDVIEPGTGGRRFDLAIRFDEAALPHPDALATLPIPASSGARLPLSKLAAVQRVETPSVIWRERQQRRAVVQANVRGDDLAGAAAALRERLDREIDWPEGYAYEIGGRYEHLQRARRRLAVVIPAALALVLALVRLSTQSWRDTWIVMTGAPLAAIGGVAALGVRGMPLSLSAAIGFVALAGVAMLNGLVLASTIQRLRAAGRAWAEAVEQAMLTRLRPVLMTGLVAGLGFVPMMLNTGVGAEIQRPLATVVVGGILSDTLLTLLGLPALYMLFGRRDGAAPPDQGLPSSSSAATTIASTPVVTEARGSILNSGE